MQAYFKNVYDVFASHPNVTMIALQYGATSPTVPGAVSAGSGSNYWDVAGGSFGFNAFFVARLNATLVRPFDVYYLVQWCGAPGIIASSGFGLAPGAPGQVQGLGSGNSPGGNSWPCTAFQIAIGVGGTGGTTGSVGSGNPWKGGMNALTGVLGIDTKAQSGPTWGAPPGGGTGVIVFPRSNVGSNGAFRSQTQNCASITYFQSDVQQQRYSIVADDDSVVFINDFSDNGNYFLTYGGMYSARPNVSASVIQYPYMMLGMGSNAPVLPLTFTDQQVYGDVAGTANNQGGIAGMASASCASMQLDHLVNNFLVDTNFWPDRQMFAGGTYYNEFPIMVGVFEQQPVQQSGYLGQLTFLKEMYNVATNDTKSDFSRIFLGTTTLAQSKISAPWDSQNNTVPRSGTGRAGTNFSSSLGAPG